MAGNEHKDCLLIVDDSGDTRELLQRNLAMQGYEVLTAADVAQALSLLESRPVDLVITDLKLPGPSGLELVRHVRENLKNTEVMMITGYPSVEGAVAAVKSGAEEYLAKPFTKEELLASVRRALEKLRLRTAGRGRSEQEPESLPWMVGESEPMLRAYKAAERAAASSSPVLLQGEPGTGRGWFARTIHAKSGRSPALFIRFEGAGAEEEEAALFYRAGGADPDAPPAGYLAAARGGTLYIPEITECSPAFLARLFLGRRIQADDGGVLLIASTHKDLRSLVMAGTFPDDVFVRLSMNTLSVPPLRERGTDVILLARRLLAEACREAGRPEGAFTDRALEALRNHSWPGNLVELINLTRLLASSVNASLVDVADLPPGMRYSAGVAAGAHRSLADVEAEHIRNVMTGAGGNKTRAAEILGINRKTLRDKLKQLPPAASTK